MTRSFSFAPVAPGQTQETAPASTILQQLAAQYAGPLAAPAVQQSEYLSDALANLSDVAPTIRTSGALASNLLADALLQHARRKSDQALMSAITSGRTAALNQGDLPGEVSAPDQPPPQAPGGLLSRLASGIGNLIHGAGAQGAQAAPQGPTGAMVGPSVAPAPQSPPVPSNGPGLNATDGQGAAGPSPQVPAIAGPQGQTPPHAPPGLVDALASQSRGVRDNNPLNVTNLGHGAWNGQTGSDGQYAVFDNPQDGWSAADKNLTSYGKLHGIDTVSGVVNRWAPAAGGNNPGAYAQTVAGGLGISPNDHVNLSDPNVRHSILSGMAKVETGVPLQFGQSFGSQGQGGPAPPKSPFAQSNSPNSNQSTATGQQLPPAPRPVQLATGPDPSVPSPNSQGPVGASPFASQRPGPAQQQAPQGQPIAGQGSAGQQPAPGAQPQPAQAGPGGGFQPQPVPLAPWQLERLNTLKQQAESDPRYMQPFLAYKAELQHQTSTPEELVISRPNDAGQVTVTGKSTGRVYGVQSAPGAIVQAGPRMAANGQGGFSPVAGTGDQVLTSQQANALGYHGNSVVTQNQATGQTSVSQQPDFGPTDYLSQRSGFINGDSYQTASKTIRAVNAVQKILGGSTGNNGAVDTGALDNLVQAETGLSAKVGTMKLFLENYDLPATIQNQILHLTGPGSITPEHLAQALNVLRSYGAAHTQAAQRELDGLNGAVAGVSGGRYRDLNVQVPQMDPMPNVPWMGAANPAMPGSPANSPAWANGQQRPGGPQTGNQASAIAQAQDAIRRGAPRAAVIQRLQSMGINPAGL